MGKIKKIIKRAFSTPDKIEEMSFLEIILYEIVDGMLLGLIITLIKLVLFIVAQIVLIITLILLCNLF